MIRDSPHGTCSSVSLLNKDKWRMVASNLCQASFTASSALNGNGMGFPPISLLASGGIGNHVAAEKLGEEGMSALSDADSSSGGSVFGCAVREAGFQTLLDFRFFGVSGGAASICSRIVLPPSFLFF